MFPVVGLRAVFVLVRARLRCCIVEVLIRLAGDGTRFGEKGDELRKRVVREPGDFSLRLNDML